MQGKNELPLNPSSTPTPSVLPDTPTNNTVAQPKMTTGPKLIRPDEMGLYMRPGGNEFFKVPFELRSDNDGLGSDSELDFTI
ncbi:hypothetical protein J2N86_05880 [Legionella lytica]|uniref:Uncharacterized protein n=1 Tax=Legionella lytica TaxID=96232 RepID=A0ABY4YB39_9GAMM|nr:hypothetical protein [Legionella lytica]USQ14829.1 hypothetical protein J2N86_05880 [Legionella lytica]